MYDLDTKIDSYAYIDLDTEIGSIPHRAGPPRERRRQAPHIYI